MCREDTSVFRLVVELCVACREDTSVFRLVREFHITGREVISLVELPIVIVKSSLGQLDGLSAP